MRFAISSAVVAVLASMVGLPGTSAPGVQATVQSFDPPLVVQVTGPPATLRSMQEMLADQTVHPPIQGVPEHTPFHPAMDPEAYATAKAMAAATPQVENRYSPHSLPKLQARL